MRHYHAEYRHRNGDLYSKRVANEAPNLPGVLGNFGWVHEFGFAQE